MASQDAPVHYQQGDRGHYDVQPEPPFVSGMPEKLDAHISATEEEINEHGEIWYDNSSAAHMRLHRPGQQGVILKSSPFLINQPINKMNKTPLTN